LELCAAPGLGVYPGSAVSWRGAAAPFRSLEIADGSEGETFNHARRRRRPDR